MLENGSKSFYGHFADRVVVKDPGWKGMIINGQAVGQGDGKEGWMDVDNVFSGTAWRMMVVNKSTASRCASAMGM